MDAFIKTLTAIKLMVQLAFYGLLLGGLLWFLLDNPIPRLLKAAQEQAIQAALGR